MEFDYDSELYICIDCIKNNKLKKYILQSNTESGLCSFCHKNNKVVLDIFNNKHFFNFLRALIRYYFWEDEYNRHFGGVTCISQLLQDENYFLYSERIIDDLVFDSLECGINEYKWYDKSIVELYYGRENGIRTTFGERYMDKRDNSLSKLEAQLLDVNYFLLEEETLATLSSYKKYYESKMYKGDILYRARIGYKSIVKNEGFDIDYTDKDTYNKYIPYKNEEIGAPPIKNTSPGRLNRLGVSFLYLATNINTSLAEVRPHPGHKISIGSFQCINDLKIVDFDIAFIRLSENEDMLQKFIYLNHIDQLLSRPITPDERHLYIITQFFADLFRKMGFDGISFTSSVGTGQNILIFNPSEFKYIEKESSVHEIKSLHYKSKQIT